MSETTLKEVLTNPETYENVARPVPEKEEGKAYALRALEAKDVFLMSKIISTIGINEFKGIVQSDAIKSAISGKEVTADLAASVGITVMLDIANVILGNLSKCEKDIYAFLSGLSGIDKKRIESMPMNTFVEMVIDVIQKEEFKDFIGVVSKLFK